jgi:hypothetical protein
MNRFLTDEQVETAKKMELTVYKCPVSGKPILGSWGNDDKVICSCHEGNPNAPHGIKNIEKRTSVHHKTYLEMY